MSMANFTARQQLQAQIAELQKRYEFWRVLANALMAKLGDEITITRVDMEDAVKRIESKTGHRIAGSDNGAMVLTRGGLIKAG